MIRPMQGRARLLALSLTLFCTSVTSVWLMCGNGPKSRGSLFAQVGGSTSGTCSDVESGAQPAAGAA